jgi:hypothetical protein
MTSTTPETRLTVRDLPFAARLTLSLFLISVGIGYCSALVQLHFQHAKPGKFLPDGADAAGKFHGPLGEKPMSKIEQLLEAPENLKLIGTGQMRTAFTVDCGRWKRDIEKRASSKNSRRREATPEESKAAEKELRLEREGERLALLAWIRAGADKKEWDKDSYCPTGFGDQPITEEYLVTGDDGKPLESRTVKIATLFKHRCIRCHVKEGSDRAAAANFPLETYEQILPYVRVQQTQAMSLTKLAQTTHVHLLGFSMLYGLTGLLFAFTSYPAFVRVLLCPLPLLVQVIDIACWWLARYDPVFAYAIPITGAIVAVGLLLQIVLSLFSMYGKGGKVVLLLLFLAAGAGAGALKVKVIDPFLTHESSSSGSVEGGGP